jgi:hypothetical protein
MTPRAIYITALPVRPALRLPTPRGRSVAVPKRRVNPRVICATILAIMSMSVSRSPSARVRTLSSSSPRTIISHTVQGASLAGGLGLAEALSDPHEESMVLVEEGCPFRPRPEGHVEEPLNVLIGLPGRRDAVAG